MIQLTSRRILRDCKRTACDCLDDLVRCASASVPMDPWSLWSIVPFPLVRVCHQYYIALLGMVVINVLICVVVITSAQTRLV